MMNISPLDLLNTLYENNALQLLLGSQGCISAYPQPLPEGRGGKNAKGRHGENLQDIGKRIDVNAFEIELFYNKNTLCYKNIKKSG